jgi:predicted O-methyltransferase YrrM
MVVSALTALLRKIADVAAAAVVTLGGPFFRSIGRWPGSYPLFQKAADKAGVQWRSTHYYHPTYADADLPADVTGERNLPGLDLREEAQLALLEALEYQSELARFEEAHSGPLSYSYDNDQYGPFDADALYAMLRRARPAHLIEIGSGHSTRIAKAALDQNRAENSGYTCRHLCIEPFEMPWLEQLGVEVMRKRVEHVDPAVFETLEAGDVLFIDSSHVIRPFGDVLTEFLSIIPRLKPGVLVHVHDIFTPREYPESWLREERRLWNEQYLLEAMLAHNPRYETLLALNWLKHNHGAALAKAFPILTKYPKTEPGAFWFKVAD